MNYPAASYGVSDLFRHAGLDPASSLPCLDSGFRRNDGTAASRGEWTVSDSTGVRSLPVLLVGDLLHPFNVFAVDCPVMAI